jgi:hypothetical protein
VIALVVAALTFGLANQVIRPSTLKLSLTAGSGFTITSNIYNSPACSGSTALLYPGVTRCLVYTVTNNLTAPISVQSINMALDNTYPAPPSGCSAADLSLPTFSGPLNVPGSGTANSPGLPISLTDNGNQNNCESTTLHFVYTGSAQYTDSTGTVLASSLNPSNSGQSVTFTATVTANNASSDSSNPTGTVNFYSCASATNCSTLAPTLLGSGTVAANGKATFATTSLATGSTFVEAVYQGASTNFTSSTSNVVTQVVNSSGVSTTTTLTSGTNPSVFGGSVTFTATVAKTTGTGTPTGTVNFYSCPTSACGSTTLLGSGTLSSGKTTYSTSSLPIGTTYVEAVYQGVAGSFGASTSNVVTQVVTSIATTTSLTSAPNPSVFGGSVTFTATVAKTTGTGTPTGTVNFYSCPTSACGSTTLLGSGTLSSGKTTYSTSSLPIGTTYVEAVYQGVAGSFGASTSNVVTQVVTSIATTTSLTSAPNPSLFAGTVTLSATVTKSSGTATPGGSVSFFSGTPSGTHSLLGTGTLNGSTQATFTTSGLLVGTDSLYAVYGGNSTFTTSTSPVISQLVIGPPAACTGSYTNVIIGNPSSPIIVGPSGNDFMYLFGANYIVAALNGNDCFDAGDGNNAIGAGNGNDVVITGNGNNGVLLGNGNDSITVGNGSNAIAAANGNNAVTVGNGSHNMVILGNGNDTVTVGSGSNNTIDLESGTDTVTIASPGSNDTINGGVGNETIYFGSGTSNTYNGAAHSTNVCHLPAPPSSWHGTTAAYYHDTLTNCSVVSP